MCRVLKNLFGIYTNKQEIVHTDVDFLPDGVSTSRILTDYVVESSWTSFVSGRDKSGPYATASVSLLVLCAAWVAWTTRSGSLVV